MSKQDYYEVLSVGQTASEKELKTAYRRLAMKYHPDRNPDDDQAEAKFKEAKEAYEVLSDPNKRATYDQFGHAGLEQGGMGGGGAGFGDVFGDIFGDIFGGRGGGRSNVYRGQDVQYEVQLSLEEAVFGVEKTISMTLQEACEACDGSGAEPGSTPDECETCGGVGQVRMQQGFFSVQQTCPTCRGAGQTISDPCTSCLGEARVPVEKDIIVEIPAGVDTGDRIRRTGDGEAGINGGPSGDLYVRVNVLPHPIFERQENHLYCDVPISYQMAAVGGSVEVPSLDGRQKMKVPSGTQSGRLFKLAGKGVTPVRGGPKGDLICRVQVETPVNLSKEQKKLLAEFDQSLQDGGTRHNPKEASWVDNAKGFFDSLKSRINENKNADN